ncbi:DeoR/GlpR family DNA-binding transcription regulator, partial [Tropicimonas sp. IMCC34043]|uniref:DeoR/GlpR family DNA-binding transcription regulator n=1 Tax=Tropicimonas sp. IMCC34043 TaxID=2248760 RepID=UPI0013006B2B
MKAKERRQSILELLVDRGSVQVDELLARYQVSRMTLHRDLEELVDEGWAARIRGGITVVSDTQFESDFRFRQHVNVAEKTRIAKAAARMVSDGQAISLGFGSTVAQMLPSISKRSELTVATASMPILQGLANLRNIELLVVGGQYIQRFDGFFGRRAELGFADFMVDICFLSTSALKFPDVYHQDERVVRV